MAEWLTNSSGTNLDIDRWPRRGEGHAYMDVGGRATQEQLPRMP